MSSFADELRRQGLLDDIISLDSTPSSVGAAPATGGLETLREELLLRLAV